MILFDRLRDEVTIRDDNSTYGTRVGEQLLQKSVSFKISDGDIVKFGAVDSVVRFRRENWRLCCTRLDKATKETMKALALAVGATIVADTDTASHLIINKFVATTKVLRCLVDGKPIVTIEWLKSFGGDDVVCAAPVIPTFSEFTPSSEYADFQQSRSSIFTDLVVLVLRAEDDRDYRFILEKCGAIVVPCYVVPTESPCKVIEQVQLAVKTQSRAYDLRRTHVFLREDSPLKDSLMSIDTHFAILLTGIMAKCILLNKGLSDVAESYLSQVQVVSSSQSQYPQSQIAISSHENPIAQDIFEEISFVASSISREKEGRVDPVVKESIQNVDPPSSSPTGIIMKKSPNNESPTKNKAVKRGRPIEVLSHTPSAAFSPKKRKTPRSPVIIPQVVEEHLVAEPHASVALSPKTDLVTEEFYTDVVDFHNISHSRSGTPQVTKSIIDDDGWITNGNTCTIKEHGLFRSSPSNLLSSEELLFVKAVTIEKEISFIISSNLRERGNAPQRPRDISGNDKRKFKKNFVRMLPEEEMMFNMHMDRVLPKESEREVQVCLLNIFVYIECTFSLHQRQLQLRLEAEVEEKQNLESEEIFADR